MACAVLAAWAALAAGAGGALAQGPAAPELVIGAHLYPRPFGLTYVYGQLRPPAGAPPGASAGQGVSLYGSGFPFTAWAPLATMTTDFKGYWSFHTTIAQSSAFRAIWQSPTPVQSRDRVVELPLKLTLRASRARRKLVNFRGGVRPAHPGAAVELQQLDRHGRFRTVGHALVGATATFTGRVGVRRPGVFRALFTGDGQFGTGVSRQLRIEHVK